MGWPRRRVYTTILYYRYPCVCMCVFIWSRSCVFIYDIYVLVCVCVDDPTSPQPLFQTISPGSSRRCHSIGSVAANLYRFIHIILLYFIIFCVLRACVCMGVPLQYNLFFKFINTAFTFCIHTHTLILYYSVDIHNIVGSIYLPPLLLYACYFRRTGASLLLMYDVL